MKVYLAGPINARSDEDAISWRQYVKSKLDVDFLDPMDRDYRGKEEENYKEIVEADKHDISSADIVLVNADRPSYGTAMEIYVCWTLHIPVLFVGPTPISPWVRYHATKIFSSLDEAMDDIWNFI